MLYKFDNNKPVIGKNTYVSQLAHVIGNVEIADNCYIGHGVILRGDYGRIEIKSGTAVEEGVIMHAPPDELCSIGEKVTIGHGAVIHSRRIDNFAVIGMGAVLSLRSEVGVWAIIGEGGIVKSNQLIPDEVVAVGNPVKIVRKVESRDKDHWNKGKQVYIDLAKKYLETGMKTV
ncbi:MAG: gamma carbonic anhydrase family protein [Spirochaetes bacterium]|nr:gamma carbonic anhydrase family protein [Spirochaetota bacterium]